MLEWVYIGGWVIVPILGCSVVAFGVILERFWSLRENQVIPYGLVSYLERLVKDKALTPQHVAQLQKSSPLGKLLAAALLDMHHSPQVMKDSIEDAGRHVVIKLEKYLNMLGTIALISPLLGLLGTVIGMIKVFTVMTMEGANDPSQLAGGISEALVTTAAGLCVAIPSLMFYRFFQRRVDELVVIMEQEALKLVEILFDQREAV